MAQTTGAITGSAAAVSIKIAAGAYVDHSGTAQSVDVVTATRVNDSTFTFDGANPIILLGKEEAVEVTVNFLYTEVALEAWELTYAAFKAGDLVQVKWEPKGSTGKQCETMAGGYITSIDFPAVDASSAGPVVASITVMAPGITYAA
jgi:hypothetical protein